MMTTLTEPFFTSLLSNALKLVPFKRISQLLQFDCDIIKTSSYSVENQRLFEDIIRQKYPHIRENYIIDKFSKYPHAMVINKQRQLQGLMLINYFEYKQEIYLYIGPIFFLSKLALSLGAMTLLEHFVNQTTCLNLLGELQNVELLIHMHTIMPEGSTFPEADTFAWSEEAKKKLSYFIAHVKQLDQPDEAHFKSKATYTLFKERPGQREVLNWLKRHQVDLEQGENLFVLSILNQQDLPGIRQRVWSALLNYPMHRIEYINKIERQEAWRVFSQKRSQSEGIRDRIL
jgi:hypothetical protein